MLKRVLLAGVMVLAVAAGSAQAQEAYVELMRQDIKTQKVAIITAVMDFTDEEAKIFWPIYREYDLELSALNDEHLAQIKSYAGVYDKLTDESAQSMGDNWFKLQDNYLKLKKKYFKRVAKEMNAVHAARFTQIENQIDLVLDLQVAANLPLMEKAVEATVATEATASEK